jgi:hypothetical protein
MVFKLILLFFFGDLNSGIMLAKQALYHLSHTSRPFCSAYFWRWGLENYLPGLASNCNPPDELSLPSS